MHVEAALDYEGTGAADRIDLLRERGYVVEDLVCGLVGDDHPLTGYLRRHGFGDDDLAWCREHAQRPHVMGVNYYPHWTPVEIVDGMAVGPRPVRRDGTEGLEACLRRFAARYGAPVFVTETSTNAGVAGRLAWLEESVALVGRLRGDGLSVVGYTWWPLFDLVDWSYREGGGPPQDYLATMGMYALEPDAVGLLERVETPVLARFRELARSGVPGVASR